MRRPRSSRVLALAATFALLGVTAQAAHAEGASTDPASTAPAAPSDDGTAPVVTDGLADPVDAALAPEKAAKQTLKAHQDRYKIADPDGTLKAAGVQKDGSRETVRLDQTYQGLPVYGAQYVVRMEKSGGKRTVTGTSGTYYTGLSVDTGKKVLPVETAVSRAVDAVQQGLTRGVTLMGAEKTPLTGTDGGLVVVPGGTGVLARKVTVTGIDGHTGTPVRQDAYVDAATGGLVALNNQIQTFAPMQAAAPAPTPAAAAPASVSEPPPSGNGVTPVVGEGTTLGGKTVPVPMLRLDDAGTYVMADITRTNATGGAVSITTYSAWGVDDTELWAPGTWPDRVQPFAATSSTLGKDLTDAGAVDAAWAAGEVFDYWKNKHGRISLDGNGMAINSYVGLSHNGGYPYANAFWDGVEMVYYTGDDEYLPMDADLDVVGHEMTHGVVSHTAQLIYGGQPGALNEAIADYFGNGLADDAHGVAMNTPNDGLIGGDLCRTLAPQDCALRDLNDGATTADFLALPELGAWNDSGGVHLNSTIVSGALWDIRQALGGDVADKIVYRALTDYLTPSSGFVDARDAVISSAQSYGLRGKDLKTVTQAFDSRGITAKWESSLAGKGTRVLVDRIGAGALNGLNLKASTAGGWFAASQTDAEGAQAPQVIVGKTDGSVAPHVVSLPDGNWNTDVVTDGKRVVWLSWNFDTKIMSVPVTGGTPKVLYETTNSVHGLGMDGNVVAWSEYLGGTSMVLRYMDDATGAIKTVPDVGAGPGELLGSAEYPAVKDGKIAFLRAYVKNGDDYVSASGVQVYDLKTGTTADAGRDEWVEAIGLPAISSAGVAWEVDPSWGEVYGDDLWWNNSVRTYTFADGKARYLAQEGTPSQLATDAGVSISDTTVTIAVGPTFQEYQSWKDYSDSPSLNTRLEQYDLQGKYLGPATCSTGAGIRPSAGLGREVVYFDSAASAFSLAYASGAKKC